MGLFRSAFDAIRKGLAKTAAAVGGQLRSLLLGRSLSEELIDEIESRLIAADVGVKAARELVAGLRADGPVVASAVLLPAVDAGATT